MVQMLQPDEIITRPCCIRRLTWRLLTGQRESGVKERRRRKQGQDGERGPIRTNTAVPGAERGTVGGLPRPARRLHAWRAARPVYLDAGDDRRSDDVERPLHVG